MRRLRTRRGIAAIVVAVAVIATGIWWFGVRSTGSSASSTAATKQLVAVSTGSMGTTVSAEGTVAAAQTDDLSFTSSGTVTAVNVKAGDAVTAGQVLATIDSASLQSAVTSAKASLASANATLSDDRSASASSAQITADEANVTSANDALTTAQSNLDGASLVATFDGTVSTVDLTVGETLGNSGTSGTSTTGSASGSGQSSSSLGSSSASALPGATSNAASSSSSSSTSQIQVVSKGRYTVDLSIDSDNVDEVAVGQSAKLTVTTSSASGTGGLPAGFPAFLGGGGATGQQRSGASSSSGSTGATATGTVTAVSKVADASSGVAKYPVTITFNADSKDFYVGATVTGDISTDVRNNVVQVSSRAITTTNGASTVVVATDGTLTGPTETRTVQTGLTADGMTEITSGLEVGDKVVVTTPGFPSGFSPPSGGTGGGGFQPPSGGGFQPPPGFGGGG
jgi:multidrug efflux pump subunit AcrA (membrane-fusion protein)